MTNYLEHFSKKEYKKAIGDLLKLEKILVDDKNEAENYFSVLVSLGGGYIIIDEYEKSELWLNKALHYGYLLSEEQQKEGNQFYLALYSALDSLANCFIMVGNEEKAITIYKQLMELAVRVISPSTGYHSDASLKLGNLLIKDGLYKEAELVYGKAIKYAEAIPDTTTQRYANLLHGQAFLLSRTGQFQASMELLLKSNRLIRGQVPMDMSDYLASLNTIAFLYYRMGVPYFLKGDSVRGVTGKIVEQLKDHFPLNYVQHIIAPIFSHISDGNLKLADSLVDLSDKAFIKYGLSREDMFYSEFLNTKAFLAHKHKNYKDAEIFYLQSLAIQAKAVPNLQYAYTLTGLGVLYLDMKEYLKSEKAIYSKDSFQLDQLRKDFLTLTEAGKANYLEKNYFNSMSGAANSLLFFYPNCSNQFIEDVFNLELLSKSLILSHSGNLMEKLRATKDESIAQQFLEWKKSRALLYHHRLNVNPGTLHNLSLLAKQVEALEVKLIELSPEFAKAHESINIRFSNIQKKLANSEAAIEFVRFHLYKDGWLPDQEYGAFIVQKNSTIPSFVKLFSEKRLTQLFDSAARQMVNRNDAFYRGAKVTGKTVNSFGKELYSLVWSPLEPFLKNINIVSFAPAGMLNEIAFNALRIDSSSFLSDRYQLRQYTSTRFLALQPANKSNLIPSSIGLFGFASFSMDSTSLVKDSGTGEDRSSTGYARTNGMFPIPPVGDLPGTESEVLNIEKLYKTSGRKVDLFTKTLASEKKVKALDGAAPSILHIATHGFYIRKPPVKNLIATNKDEGFVDDPLMRSGLLLAGANYVLNGNQPIPGIEDGVLTAYEVSQLDLSNTDLVVLSACQTGMGDIRGAEGVFGLQRAFKMAGVKQMIISLWDIPDQATADLMTDFYSRWLMGGSARDALDAAQAQMRKNKIAPYSWAGFVLVE